MQRYRLIFDGHTRPQDSLDDVRRRLAGLYQVTPPEIETLFARPPVVIKENLEYQEALKDKADFEATGALCRLEAQPAPLRAAVQAGEAQSGPVVGRRRFGLQHPYLLAFFSRPFYADVMAHWRGLAFVHLALLLLLSAAAYTIHFRDLIAVFIAREAPAILAQVPEIRILDGKVHVDVDEPYTIRQPGSDTALAVIDTTGEITSLRQTDATLLLTATRLIARLSAAESRTIDLSGIESLRIDRSVLSQWLLDFQSWVPFIIFPLALGVTFTLRSAQALLYGVIGLAMASLQKVTLPYGATVSVAIMAMTPFLLLDVLLMLLDIYPPLWGLGGFLMAMGYLAFGIRSAAHKP